MQYNYTTHVLFVSASCTTIFFMWGRESQAVVTPVLTGYPIGEFLAPLLVRPFLCDTRHVTSTSVYNVSNTSGVVYTVLNTSGVVYTVSNTSDVSSDVNDDAPCYSAIEVPHLIVGCLSLSISLVFLAFFLAPSPAGFTLSGPKRLTLKETLSLSACKPGNRNKWYATNAMILLSLYFIAHIGRNGIISNFLFTYATEGDLNFSKQEAAWLDFSVKMSFFVGRVISIPAMKYLSLDKVMIGNNGLSAVFAVCLLIVGRYSKLQLALWSCFVLGFSGGNWPAGYSWMHQTLFMGGLILGLLDVVICAAFFVTTNMTGYFLSNDMFDALIYMATGYSVFLFVVAVTMQFFASFGRHRARAFACTSIRKDENLDEKSRPLMFGNNAL